MSATRDTTQKTKVAQQHLKNYQISQQKLMYVLNVVKVWLKTVFLVTGAHNGNIGHLLTLVKMPLRHCLGIMKICIFCSHCLAEAPKALSLYQTYSKLDGELDNRFQSSENKLHKGIGQHLAKCLEAANVTVLEDSCKKLQKSVKIYHQKLIVCLFQTIIFR